MQQDSLDTFLQGGVPGYFNRDSKVGDSITLVVDDARMAQQRDYDTNEPLTYDDGNPKMQMIITGVAENLINPDTDDDGRRSVYVKGKARAALTEAIKKSGARKFQTGSTVTVKFEATEPVTLNSGKRGSDRKVWSFVYTPPKAGFNDEVPF